METERSYEFGTFRLDAVERLLFRGSDPVPLTPRAADTLLYLVQHREHTVGKQELIERVWGGAFVEDGSLSQTIWMLRKALGDTAGSSQFIETIPKRGYRFIAAVREASGWDGSRLKSGIGPEVGPAPTEVYASANARARTKWALWLGVAAVVAVAIVVSFAWRRSFARGANPSGRMMLAVLPVQNLSGNPGREYIADGLTEEMIAQLGGFNPQKLGVIARTSSMAYKRTDKTVDQIARELGADYILETSLRESGNDLRFTAQLIRTSDQTHLWAHSYQRPLADVVALQGELAKAIAEEIRVGLGPQQAARMSARHAVQPEAYDAFIQGRYHWNERSAAEVRRAIGYFEQAAAKEHDFAPAYAGLADSYTLLTMMRNAAPKEMMPKAKDALLKALSLDDSLADAHTTLAEVLEVFDWNWADADREYRRAIELEPNNANSHHQYAIHLAVMGHFPDALAEMQQAQRLDPVSPVMFTSTGWILLRGRAPDRAMAECLKALDLDPKFARGHLCLGEAYEEKKDLVRAAEEFLAGRTLAGMTPEAAAELRKAIEESGYQGYFRLRLEQLTEKSKTEYVSPYDLADFWLRLGDREQALHWLEAAYAERSPYLVFLHLEPRMDPLRSDVRFQNLARRIGLPEAGRSSLDHQP